MNPRQSPAPIPGGGFGKAFVPYPVAQTSQRTNGSGFLAATGAVRASQVIQGSIGAGNTVQYPAAGKSFYLQASSGPINIRPSNGSWDTYTPGTGLDVDDSNLFSLVEVQNTSANPIAFSLWVGFGSYIDRRLILATGTNFPVAYPTNPTPGAVGPISIPDLSGQAFLDLSGASWLALYRIAILISNFNASGGTTYSLQDYAGTGKTVLAIQPGTSAYYASSGNFSIKAGLSAINCSVSEIYNAIPNTL